MSDELVKRLRQADAPYAKPTALEILTDEAADLIEQQVARIAALEAQIAALTRNVDGWKLVPVEPTSEMVLHNSDCQHHAWDDKECPMRAVRFKVWRNMIAAAPDPDPVAPAVDAQPVAWIDEYALRSLESNATAVCAPIGMRDENQTIPLYTSAQSEGLRKDAERYRHLRQCNSGSLVIVQIIGTGEDDQIVLTEEHADEAIDTALSQHTGEKDD